MTEPNEKILEEIYRVISSRKYADPETSYTARLFAKGIKKIAQKLGEEAVDTVVAAVGESEIGRLSTAMGAAICRLASAKASSKARISPAATRS